MKYDISLLGFFISQVTVDSGKLYCKQPESYQQSGALLKGASAVTKLRKGLQFFVVFSVQTSKLKIFQPH